MTLRQADATLIPPFWLPKIFMPSSVMFCGVVVIAVTSLLMRMAGSSHSDTDPRIVTCRSEEHTSELQSLMRISSAVFCLKKQTRTKQTYHTKYTQLLLQIIQNA